MRIVIQRVSRARVTVNGEVTGAIGAGLVVLLGVGKGDSARDAESLAGKTVGLRIFPDEHGKMNRSIADAGGALLVVSQFTLLGDCRKGKRPSFDKAADTATAERLYQHFVETARQQGIQVETGTFRAHMDVELVNDGPVTLIIESFSDP
jgi:D-tyrosyl-tRNA(Tyr) deacylase